MPFYDLRCGNCNKDFTIRSSVSDRTEKRIACPECGSTQLETIYKPIHFHVKKADPPVCPNSHICGSECRHAH